MSAASPCRAASAAQWPREADRGDAPAEREDLKERTGVFADGRILLGRNGQRRCLVVLNQAHRSRSRDWNATSDINAHVDRVCNLQLRYPDSMTRLIAEHGAIISAIDARDAEAAAGAMRNHLNGILADLPQIEADNPNLFD